jgi:hypothetical protein
LVRDEDTEAVSLLQSRIHEQAVEVLVVEKKTQQHLDAVSGMSARVKDETDKLLKQAKKLLGKPAPERKRTEWRIPVEQDTGC